MVPSNLEEPERVDVSDEKEADGLAERTVALVETAIDRMRAEAHLPGVGPEEGVAEVDLNLDPVSLEDLGRAAVFLRTRSLGWILALGLLASGVGVGVALNADLVDWYMHGAMYVVILSFLVIYVKTWRRPFARALYGTVSLVLILGFAWTLHDLVPPRTVATAAGLAPRDAIPGLDLPALLLLVLALALAAHGVLVRAKRAHV